MRKQGCSNSQFTFPSSFALCGLWCLPGSSLWEAGVFLVPPDGAHIFCQQRHSPATLFRESVRQGPSWRQPCLGSSFRIRLLDPPALESGHGLQLGTPQRLASSGGGFGCRCCFLLLPLTQRSEQRQETAQCVVVWESVSWLLSPSERGGGWLEVGNWQCHRDREDGTKKFYVPGVKGF